MKTPVQREKVEMKTTVNSKKQLRLLKKSVLMFYSGAKIQQR